MVLSITTLGCEWLDTLYRYWRTRALNFRSRTIPRYDHSRILQPRVNGLSAGQVLAPQREYGDNSAEMTIVADSANAEPTQACMGPEGRKTRSVPTGQVRVFPQHHSHTTGDIWILDGVYDWSISGAPKIVHQRECCAVGSWAIHGLHGVFRMITIQADRCTNADAFWVSVKGDRVLVLLHGPESLPPALFHSTEAMFRTVYRPFPRTYVLQ